MVATTVARAVTIATAALRRPTSHEPSAPRSGITIGQAAHALAVVMAAERYPPSPATGDRIEGLDAPVPEGAYVYHAGTRRDGEAILTAGGRVLTVGAHAASLAEARDLAYRAVSGIRWRGEHHRTDIGHHALG